LIPLSFGFEKEKREATNSGDEKKKELRRVYRKLKGVRSQISMKTKELKKEVKEAAYMYKDEMGVIPETDEYERTDSSDDDWSSEENEIGNKEGPTGTQFELKMLVDRKTKLRKRFQKLQEEVRRK
jgi:hypothetical protein